MGTFDTRKLRLDVDLITCRVLAADGQGIIKTGLPDLTVAFINAYVRAKTPRPLTTRFLSFLK